MAWTQADIDKLKAAIAAGGPLQSMTFADQTFAFKTIDDQLKLLAVMQQEVNSVAGAAGYRLAATSKGA